MIEIRPLVSFEDGEFKQIAVGYTAVRLYQVEKQESPEFTAITLRLTERESPYHKVIVHDPEDLERYHNMLAEKLSLGAYLDERLVAVCFASAYRWNKSVWIWEFHVHPDFQGRGIGLQMMAAMIQTARAGGYRVLVCETQNTNVPAINFYRKAGFMLEGVDLSLYSNQDMETGEVAVFMKFKLE